MMALGRCPGLAVYAVWRTIVRGPRGRRNSRGDQGFEYYRHVQIPPDEPPPAPPQPSDDELELERDMEYFVEPEEALGARGETIE